MTADAESDRVFFDAMLTPHRSLSPRGFLIVMALLSAISFVAGMSFVLKGAWPVLGFFGLDVLLVYLAFRANYRAARRCEFVTLTARLLTVRRIDPLGREQRVGFEPHWLRVEIDEAAEHAGPLILASHGRRLEIGAFLSPPERVDLARALRRALAERREAMIGSA